MALNQEYFDSIHIDVVKKKYYNANKVEAVLQDIRQQALSLTEENARMKEQLQSSRNSTMEIGEAVLSAQSVYREIVDRANAQAAQILAEAEAKREQVLEETARQQEYAVHQAEALYTRLRQQQEENLRELNSQWREFLCGLYPPEPQEEKKAPKAEPVPEKRPEAALPADLTEKVNAIARELFAIGEE